MALGIITGSCGLIGSEAVSFFIEKGFDIIGIDNNMRKFFFGEDGSVSWNKKRLLEKYRKYRHLSFDIRDEKKVNSLFRKLGTQVELVIHTAAQPSHDWSARMPMVDFGINAMGTLVLLEAVRNYSPRATFIFTSTNKVYGDTPNSLPLVELDKRFELPAEHPYYKGIDERMSIDNSVHSIFGASKVAADVMAQEYGKYFGIKTGVFRGGCLTGPLHSGAELHGFLSYLIKCCLMRRTYHIYGYKGKQVRDNIHSYDLVNAFFHFHEKPRYGEVYNMGGGRFANISVLEAIDLCERICQEKLSWDYTEVNRKGDHIWYISDVSKFKSHYPQWDLTYTVDRSVTEIFQAQKELMKKI